MIGLSFSEQSRSNSSPMHKGDGTPASKADAQQRHAHLNSTHIPDLIRYGARIDLYEWKCWSTFLAGGSLGLGSARLGGAASTVEG